MTLTGENRNTGRETFHSAIFLTTRYCKGNRETLIGELLGLVKLNNLG